MTIENAIKKITLRRFLSNLDNDLKEDGDTGVHLDMTIEEYLINLFTKSTESPSAAEADKGLGGTHG